MPPHYQRSLSAMPRSIKFRAWDGERMREWGFTERGGFFAPPSESGGLNYPQMQFTGLTDKNGKEIYEGDVVRCFDTAGGVVYDHEVQIPRFFQEIWCETQWDDAAKQHTNQTKVEIIGNIYENPDLLV